MSTGNLASNAMDQDGRLNTMAYPRTVSREFCWKHQLWRAFDGVKIVAYNHDHDDLKKLCPEGDTIKKSDTKLPGVRKGTISDGCRLHYGQPIRESVAERIRSDA